MLNSVSNKIDLSSEHDIEKKETSVREVKEHLVSPNGECLDNSQASKGSDLVHEKVEPGPVTKSDIEKLPKKLEASVEPPPTSPEKAEDARFQGAASQSLDAPKEDEMLHSKSIEALKDGKISASISEQKDQGHLVTSVSIVQNGDGKGFLFTLS